MGPADMLRTGIHVLPHVKYNGYRKEASQMTGATQLKVSHSLSGAYGPSSLRCKVYYALTPVTKQPENGNNHYLHTMSKLKKAFSHTSTIRSRPIVTHGTNPSSITLTCDMAPS